MSEVTVLRVEVNQVNNKDESSLDSKKASTSGAVGGGIALKNGERSSGLTAIGESTGAKMINGIEVSDIRYGNREDRLEARLIGRNLYKSPNSKLSGAKMYVKNISAPNKKQIGYGMKAASTGLSVYSLVSNYRKVGYQLSGEIGRAHV